MDRNKIIISTVSTIAAISLIVGLYLFFKKEPATTTEEQLPASGAFPSASSGGGGGGGRIQDRPINGGLSANDEVGLYQLVENPVSGSSLVKVAAPPNATGTSATTTTVRFFDKPTGNLYEIGMDGTGTRRLSNSTILRSFDVVWSGDTNKFVIKYTEPVDYGEDGLKYFAAQISSSSPLTIEGDFLPTNTVSVVASPVEDKIFSLVSDNEKTLGLISDFSGKAKKQVLSFDFKDFDLAWPSKNIISLNTRASGNTNGFLYALDTQKNTLSRIMGNVRGLTTLWSPKGDYLLYSQNEGDTLRMRLFDLKTKSATNLDQQTLPEKCVWGTVNTNIVYCAVPTTLPKNLFPDDWYQGLVSFNDSVWRINIASSTYEKIIDTELDITNMTIDQGNKNILLTNKKDLSLWVLRVSR